ncbi:MAG TPA: TOBE domain-containing protein, partial [Aggregatilineaceae bacterium]|nr:TOBE domain-containing protein [Aggregatilineaceae bacterium]
TSVYVTHDQTEAVALADRIAVMRSGKIEQVGTFEALYERPVNAFVAQFFGLPPMNLFPGRVYGESWEGSRFGVKPTRPGLEHGQRTLLGIRPEHVQVVDQGIPARIEHIEFNFPERRKLLYLALGEFRCVASVPLEAPGKRGERVQLAFPAEHIFLFDEASGQRVG